MATYMLNVRHQQKYDDIEKWIASDPVLLEGEIAVTTVQTAESGTTNYVPSVLMKIGDGVKKYSELDFTYAKSADVYDWAKKESLAYDDLPESLLSKITEFENIETITNDEIEVMMYGK